MRKYLAALIAAISIVAACESKTATIDHNNPTAVARSTFTAFRDRDLEALAYMFHPNHEDEVRQSALAHVRDGKAVEEWGLYTEGSEIDSLLNWSGDLVGPKYDWWPDKVAIYSAAKPDRYNEVIVLVLTRFEEGWFVEQFMTYDFDEFDSLPNSEEELSVIQNEQCAIFKSDCLRENMCEMFEEFCVNIEE